MKKEKKHEDWDDITFTEEDNTENEVKEEEEKPEETMEEPAKEPEKPAQEVGPVLAQAELDAQEQHAIGIGMSAMQAKMAAENARLRAENAALKQQSINLQRIIGSASGAGKRSYDAFEEAWYDGN